MTNDDFDDFLKHALMEAAFEELEHVWDSEPQETDSPPMEATSERAERIWRLAHQRQEEEENEPPEDL